jgi:hypothetical protein
MLKQNSLKRKYEVLYVVFLILTSTYSLYVQRVTAAHTRARARARTHTHSVGLLWMTDRPVAATSTRQYTTLTRDIHAPRNSKPQSQQAIGRRPTRPPVLYLAVYNNIL